MSSEAKQDKKKKISPKAQQIIDIVVTSLEALVVVVCIIVSVTAWVGLGKPQSRAINWFAIQTDSMMGDNADSLDPGDLMFTKRVKAITDLQPGDVIAFVDVKPDVTGTMHEVIMTHRIVSIDYANNAIKTQGDNAPEPDDKDKKLEDLIGKYSGKVKGLGKMILWLGGYEKKVTATGIWFDKDNPEHKISNATLANHDTPNEPGDWYLVGGYGYERGASTTAFLVIIIPLALLFIYNGYIVAKWILDERAKKIRAAALAEAQAGAADNAENEAAIKRAALVEFMKSQGMTEEQIDAYFASQAPAAEQAEETVEEHVDAEQAIEEIPATDTQDKPQE